MVNVIIPVAGLGTRLRPLTWSKPKPLVSVAGQPVLGHVLDRLEVLDIDRVVFVTGYLGDQIEQYVRANYDFDARFVAQREQLGQSHAVHMARGEVTGPTLIVFPDMIFEADLKLLAHIETDGAIFVKAVEDPRRFGVIVAEQGQIRELVEKPEKPISNLAVVGLYYFKRIEDLFEAIEYQMEHDLQQGNEYYLAAALQHLIDHGTTMTHLPVDVWEDCGKPEALLSTNRFLLRKSSDTPNVPGSVIVPPVVIAPTAIVRNSVIGPFASVGDGVTVTNSIVTDSIIDDGARIETVMLQGSIVGQNAFVRGDFMRVNVGDSSDIVLAANSEENGSGRG
jgi:glucose-1-phosphate thymidylyltransferase